MRYIGIDIGASFIKAALLDTDQRSIYKIIKEKTPPSISNENLGWNTLDPKELWNSVFQILLKIKGSIDIDGILVSNQMHGFIIVDKNGNSLTPYITWQDTRGSNPDTINKVQEAFGECGLLATGMPLIPGLPSLNLFQIRHRQGLNEGYFLSLGDYITYLFSGNMATHASNCAGSGLMNIKSGIWNYSAIENMECSGFSFPPIAGDFQPIGVSRKFNNSKVFPAVGDHQAALLGAMLNDKELSLNVGTGSQVSMLSHLVEFGDYEIRPFFSGDFLNTITHIPAGRALNVLVAFSQELIKRLDKRELNPQEFWNAYCDVKHTEGSLIIDLSFFTGSVSGNYGSIMNIHEGNFNTRTMLAAAYREMAKNYFYLSNRIGAEKATRGVISGGLLMKNKSLLNAIQDTFNPLPIIQRFSEDTLVGLYIIAVSNELKTTDFRHSYRKIADDGICIECEENAAF